jgi:hypothetical protein
MQRTLDQMEGSTTEDPEVKAPEHPHQPPRPRLGPGRRGTRGGHRGAAGWRSSAEPVGVLAVASLRGTETVRTRTEERACTRTRPALESSKAPEEKRGESRLTPRAVRVRPKLVCGVS